MSPPLPHHPTPPTTPSTVTFTVSKAASSLAQQADTFFSYIFGIFTASKGPSFSFLFDRQGGFAVFPATLFFDCLASLGLGEGGFLLLFTLCFCGLYARGTVGWWDKCVFLLAIWLLFYICVLKRIGRCVRFMRRFMMG